MQQQKNYLAQTALGTLLVIISLFVLYLIPEFDIGGFHFRRIDLLADILKKTTTVLFEPDTGKKKLKPVFVDTCKTGITCIEDYTTDTSGMTGFFTALSHSKNHPVRIAWFGDSYVEGDIMLDPLRDSLQAIFGGSGVGFVPITSEVSRFRQTILHEFKNWKTLSSVGNKDKDAPLGPAGYTFIPLEGNMVTYHSVNKRHLNSLPGIKVFYGQCEDATIEFHIDGSDTRDSLINGDSLQQFMLPSQCNEFGFRIPLAKKLAVYGVSFEDKTGISIDNFSMRGNSGIGLIETPETLYRQMDELHHYNLVVMSYGLNVASEKAKNYDWYIKSMNKVIKMMKRAFPHSSILLIGCSDRAQKINGDYETMPMLKELVDVQRQMAVDNQICFWNLFEAMGGDSTMVNWAGMEKHPLADKDYTHLTFRGGKKVADILLGTFLYEKEKYDRKRKN